MVTSQGCRNSKAKSHKDCKVQMTQKLHQPERPVNSMSTNGEEGSYSNLSSTFQETLKGSRNRLQQSLTDTSLVGTKGVVIIVFLPVILPFLPPPTHKNASVHHN